MNREDKAAVIDQVAEEIGGADAIFAVDYRGITVAQIKDLRVKLGAQNTTLQVTKNSLAELAADRAGAPNLKPMLVGPTALAFVKGDAAAAAKVLSDTARTLRMLESKGGYMDGVALSPVQVDTLAKLPSREVLYGQLVGVIASPISGVVRTLNALIQGLAIQLGSIADQGLVTGSAPAGETTPASAAETAPASAGEGAPASAAETAPAAESASAAETGNPDAPDGDTDVSTPDGDAPEPHEAPEKSGQETDIPESFPSETPSDEAASTDAPSTDA